MEKAEKTVVYDRAMQIEGYLFRGLAQPFPTHFHAHYVLGLVEAGDRQLCCRGRTWTLRPGSLMLLNPGDSHACTRCGEALDYRAANIPIESMMALCRELTGNGLLPVFSGPVAEEEALACQFRTFHRRLMSGGGFAAEEALLLLLSGLAAYFTDNPPACPPPCRKEISAARAYMERHFAESITLEQLCRRTGLSRSTLLRAFTRETGVTPYRYLETVRVNEAKRLLELNTPPLEAALQAGFSDQSHFTNTFTHYIGLPPGMYQRFRRRQEE